MGDCGVILVIDHDRGFRQLAEDVLGRMSHPLRAVAGAEDALAYLDGERPALVVIEVELPELSGLAILAPAGDLWRGLARDPPSAERGRRSTAPRASFSAPTTIP